MILYRENTEIILDYENGSIPRIPVGSLQGLKNGSLYTLISGVSGILVEDLDLSNFKKQDLSPYTDDELNLFIVSQGFITEYNGGGGLTPSLLLREQFTYSGSQTITLANDYAQVYSVEISGQGALNTSQYNLVAPNQITILDTLESGDYIVVFYSNTEVGVQPYYTQSETDNLLNAKQDLIVNRIYISQESDFGTLQSGKEYFITGIVTISNPITIPTGVNIRLNGYGTDISQLVATSNNFTMFSGLATGNFTSTKVAFQASGTNSQVFDIKSQTGNEAVEMEECNFNSCTKIGTLDNYRQGLGVNLGYFGGTPTYEFKGVWQGFRLSTAIIRGTSGAYSFWKAGTGFTFNGRFLTDVNAVIPTGATFCDFAVGNVLTDEGLQFTNADFNPTLSTGTVLPNIATTSTKVRVSRSRGLPNTYIGGYWNVSASANTALTGGTIAKVAGTTVYYDLSWFSSSGNNAFVSLSTKEIVVEAVFNGGFTGVSNGEYTLTIRQWDNSLSAYVNISQLTFTTNGGLFADTTESVSLISKNIVLNENDRIEVWVQDANATGNDITMNLNSILKLREIQS